MIHLGVDTVTVRTWKADMESLVFVRIVSEGSLRAPLQNYSSGKSYVIHTGHTSLNSSGFVAAGWGSGGHFREAEEQSRSD